MKNKKALYWILVAISGITVASGLFQVLATDFELKVLSAESTATSRHFFAIVGMFMVLFGGMLLQALLGESDQPVAVLWAGLQKFGASAAVGIGVLHQIFSGLALLVAGFDLLSGILILLYWRSLGNPPGKG
ncbi:MAG TPA: patatin [bacterium]|jgi:hypothetical protein|nr:patatin [bacterium]